MSGGDEAVIVMKSAANQVGPDGIVLTTAVTPLRRVNRSVLGRVVSGGSNWGNFQRAHRTAPFKSIGCVDDSVPSLSTNDSKRYGTGFLRLSSP